MRRSIVIVLSALSVAGCANQNAREARELLAAGQAEAALAKADAGLKRNPDDAALRGLELRARADLLTSLVEKARSQMAGGDTVAAEQSLAEASKIEPGHPRVLQLKTDLTHQARQSRAKQEALALATAGRASAALTVIDEALKGGQDFVDLIPLRRRLLAEVREREFQAARTGLAEKRPISLDFRNTSLRQVLDVVTRHSGLNFVLDKDIRDDLRITVFLNRVTVDDALDLIATTHQLARKVLDDRTVLIYPNTPEKQREHQEQVIRVFYLASAEAKGAAQFLRAMLKMREPFVDERSNMLALRDTPEVIHLASRLVDLYDSAEPEVLLELEVIEIRASRLSELGVQVPSSVTLTPLSSSGGLTLESIRGIGPDRIGVSIGGVTVNLRREVGDFEVLANPRVRAKNREKARVLIGDKVPIITTTSSQSGFVSDSVSYIDVGLKLDVEPTVFANNDVSVRIGLEVSALASQIRTTSGTVAYQISTRNAGTSLRLKDGETQLLAGLLSKEERSSSTRIPLIGDLPLIGRIFSSQLDDGSRTELVLAITPRIVRNLSLPDASMAELWIGTESNMRLRSVGGRVASLPAAAASGPGARGLDSPADAAGARPPSPAPTPLNLRWSGGPANPRVGEPFKIALDGDGVNFLRELKLSLGLPPELEIVSATAGPAWGEDAAEVDRSASDSEPNRVQVVVTRMRRAASASSGSLLQLTLKPKRAGAITLQLPSVAAVLTTGESAQPTRPEDLRIEVAP